MTTTVPLTPTKLAAIPEAPHNLQVLNFIAEQGQIVHDLRPPSLSPMRNTQDRLFAHDQREAALQARQGSRSASIPLPATPPSPSASRMAEQLSSSPILKERANNVPLLEKLKLPARTLRAENDLESEVDIAKVKKRARGAVQAKKAEQRRASTKSVRPEPVLELEETAKRLELRRTRRREKALIVQDRSRPVSARLRSEARAKDKLGRDSNKENLAEDGVTTLRGATKENKKLREAVLAMEAYKPVGRLGSGKMTTQTDGLVKRGLFSKGAASAPVKVRSRAQRRDEKGKTSVKKGQLAFCEARFLQTEQGRSESDTEKSTAEEADHDTADGSRQQRSKRRTKSEERRRSSRKRPSPQVDHDSEHDEDRALTRESGSEHDVTNNVPQHRSRGDRDRKVPANVRAHYGRRRKRTLLGAGQLRKLLTSPDHAPIEDVSSSEGSSEDGGASPGSEGGSGQSGLSEYSKARKRTKAEAQQKQIETIDARRARTYEAKAAPSRQVKAREEEGGHSANLKSPHRRKRADTLKQAEKAAREAAVAQAMREMPTAKGSDDSIYFDVQVKPARTTKSNKRRLVGTAVDEETLRNSLEVLSSPQAQKTEYATSAAHLDRIEEREARGGSKHSAGPSTHDHVRSEVSHWRGSAWTSAKRDETLQSHGSTAQADQRGAVAPVAYGHGADSLPVNEHPQHPAATTPRAPTPPNPLPSRLDSADLANGWRLQHTRSPYNNFNTADPSCRANTFAGCSIERAALHQDSHLEQFSSSRRASSQDIRSLTTQKPLVLTSSPQHHPALLSSTGLGALQLADSPHACEQPEDNVQPHMEDQRQPTSHPSDPASDRASGPCIVDKREEGMQTGDEAGSPRPITAAAASTIFAGRAAWDDIRQTVDERHRSFSSDCPHEENDDGQWLPSSENAFLFSAPRAATPCRRTFRRRLSHLNSEHDGVMENEAALFIPPSPGCLERQDSEEPAFLSEQENDKEEVFHSAEDSGTGIISGPISQCSRQGSEVLEWLTPHSSPASQPFIAQQPMASTAPHRFEPRQQEQRLPSATTATRFTSRAPVSRLRLEDRTASASSYSNSSFDDLDFLSIRPGPGKFANPSESHAPPPRGALLGAGAAAGFRARTGTSANRKTRFGSMSISQQGAGTGTGPLARSAHLGAAQQQQQRQQQQGGTNFWSRQQARDIQPDLSRLRRRGGTGVETQMQMQRAASSSLDPLDMDWTE